MPFFFPAGLEVLFLAPEPLAFAALRRPSVLGVTLFTADATATSAWVAARLTRRVAPVAALVTASPAAATVDLSARRRVAAGLAAAFLRGPRRRGVAGADVSVGGVSGVSAMVRSVEWFRARNALVTKRVR